MENYNNIFTVSERKKLIAETLRVYRKLHKFTQQQVAEKIGIETQTYATYERGRNEAPAEILVRLSYLYNVPVDFLIQRDNKSKDNKTFTEQMEEMDKSIYELQGKVISGDKETRETFNKFTNQLSKLVDTMREMNFPQK